MARKKKDDYIQLDLIPPTEAEKLYKEFTDVKESSEKVRRAVFAKSTDIAKKVQDIKSQIDGLQHQLLTLTNWTLTRLGCCESPLKKQDGSHGDTIALHIGEIHTDYVTKLHHVDYREFTEMLSA